MRRSQRGGTLPASNSATLQLISLISPLIVGSAHAEAWQIVAQV
jgi:hypothetical protein